MDGSLSTIELVISAGPGVVALLSAAFGYGRVIQRIKALENDAKHVGDVSDQVSAVKVQIEAVKGQVNTIDERTKTTNTQVANMDSKLDRLIERVTNIGPPAGTRDRRSTP